MSSESPLWLPVLFLEQNSDACHDPLDSGFQLPMCPSDKRLPNLLKSVQLTLGEAGEMILRDVPALKPEAQQIAEVVLRLQKIADRIESVLRQRSA